MAAWIVGNGAGLAGPLEELALSSVADALQDWLRALSLTAPQESVFWAPHGWISAAEWHPTGSVEQLAVRISTTWKPRGNVCFASAAPGGGGRNVCAIALIERGELGWALNLYQGRAHCGDVRRVDYPYDNYDSFSALAAARISWSWIVSGTVAEGLSLRRRR